MVERFGKKYGFIMLIVFLAFSILECGSADSADRMVQAQLPDHTRTYGIEGLQDSDQLAESYLGRIMPSKRRSLLRARAGQGERLEGAQGNLYSLLRRDIAEIAGGTRSSTVMVYSAEDIYEKLAFTATDLEVTSILDESNEFTPEAIDALDRIIVFDMNAVLQALLVDCPYELYWYDKTVDINVDYPGQISSDGEKIFISGEMRVYLRVSVDYALNGDNFQCDKTYGQGARAAADNARSIVNRYAESTDEEKLTGYANEICNLTSYNFEAAAGAFSYGNPWQLIWVFDGNPDTTVVCEGYAKAFQYLCDLSTFTGDISVITVTGTTSDEAGDEAHMWNVVKMADGKNYLVDVTNIDEGMAGYPDELMLATYVIGNMEEGYGYSASGYTFTYRYDDNTLGLYDENQIAMCATIVVAIDQTNFPDDNFRAVVSGFDSDNDGMLSSSEIADTVFISCGERSISDLTGIEYFTRLEALDCRCNQLKSLDVSQNTNLLILICYDNQIENLDVSHNLSLTRLDCSTNRLTSLDISHNTALTWLECNSNKLTALDLSKNTALTAIGCVSNQLTELDVSMNTKLKDLSCYSNQLTYLNLSNNIEITDLQCSFNLLTAMDLSKNTALKKLSCDDNQLTGLDLSKNLSLTFLACYNNCLQSLDVQNNTELNTIYCQYNQIKFLDTTRNSVLVELCCDYNELTILDVTRNTALTHFTCNGNQLKDLDVTHNTALTWLTCSENQLLSLDVSNNVALSYLDCSSNLLSNLDVNRNVLLEYLYCRSNQLKELDVSMNKSLELIDCAENQIRNLDLIGLQKLWILRCSNNKITSLDVSNNTALYELSCGFNRIVCLEVSGNTALTDLICNDNVNTIVSPCDLSTLPGFDVTKASNWTGGSLEGTVLTGSGEVTYTYDCGNGFYADFTIMLNQIDKSNMLILPASLESIEEEAFATLENIKVVSIPATVVSIADDAFANNDIVIIAPAGSYAENWAEDQGFIVAHP